MASDGRYMYHNPSGVTSTYEYASYTTTPYEQAPIPPSQPQPQPPVRTAGMRSNSSQPHSPHAQSTFSQSQAPYQQTAYTSVPYSITQSAQQWTASSDNWTNYNSQSFPPPPIPEVPFSSGPGRPDMAPNPPPIEQRAFGSGQSNPDPRGIDERPAVPPAFPSSSQPKGRRRESESSPTVAYSDVTPPLDFMKLLDTYRLIIDGSNSLASAGQSRPESAETVERMMQSATYGVQMLETAATQTDPPIAPSDTRSPEDHGAEESLGETNGTKSSKAQDNDDVVQEGQTCLGCNATSTPEWRRGPMGPRTLCNACGLVYAKLIKKRARDGGRAIGKPNGKGDAGDSGPGDEVSSGGSDDDDSYGSQGRSELGDQGGRD